MNAKADLTKDGSWIKVEFPFHPKAVQILRDIPGSSFVPKEKGGPHWILPPTMHSGKELRAAFGDDVQMGKRLLKWGREELEIQRNLGTLALADDAKLPRLEELGIHCDPDQCRSDEQLAEKGLPPGYDAQPLHEWMRPYQRVSASCMASGSFINGDQAGLGKTVTTIAAIYEAGLENGWHLISAPVTSLEDVWMEEILKWTDWEVFTGATPEERELAIYDFVKAYKAKEPGVLILNPDMIMLRPEKGRHEEDTVWSPVYPDLEKIGFSTYTVDECHKMGMGNPKAYKRKAAVRIKAQVKWPMSGTIMGGKPKRLWGALNFKDKSRFRAFRTFQQMYLEKEEQTYEKQGEEHTVDVYGEIRSDKEEALAKELCIHMVRHLKKDVLPQLPDKQIIDVECGMTPKQEKQYKQFAKEAEIRIETERMGAMGVLDEYMRLKQFACAYQKVEKIGTRENKEGEELPVYRLTPQPQSAGKLKYLMERLAENGIDPEEFTGDACAVVGSQFTAVCNMVHKYLNDKGIPTVIITGDTPQKKRKHIKREFQEGGPDAPRVLVVNTLAAGVSLTLDRADTIHILDETWDPDDQEQLEDRIHRASRIHQVTCYYYRSEGTIEEYIHEVTQGKMDLNRKILDLRRHGLRAV